MTKRRIVCFYAVKRRDRFNITLLKYYLERVHGCDVSLQLLQSSPSDVLNAIRSYRADVVTILDAKSDSEIAIVESAKRLGYSVVLMPSEMQLNYRAGQHFYLAHRERFGSVTRYLSPGPMSRAFLLEQDILPPEACPVVGYPRYDYYAEPFASQLTMPRDAFLQKYALDPCVPLILWASNNRFYLVDQSKNPQAERAFLIRRYIERRFDAVYNVEEWIDAFLNSHRHSLEVVRALAQAFSGRIQLLYRPRQGEDPRWYEAYFAGDRNVRIVYEEDLNNLLRHSALVFHGFSLLGTEAWIHGTPTVSYAYQGLDRFYFDAFRDCEDIVTTGEATQELLDRFLNGRYATESFRALQAAFVERWYHAVDGASTFRAAQVIAQVAREGGPGGPYPAMHRERLTRAVKRAVGLEEFQSLKLWNNRTNAWLSGFINSHEVGVLNRFFDRVLAHGGLEAVAQHAAAGTVAKARSGLSAVGLGA